MNKGFSLVELSIVLVILGLLTGGILSGQSLIRAAELRSVTTEYGRHVASIQTFRDKYMAIPGDFKDATKFWGAAHAAPATCNTTSSNSLLTCDGNGNGVVEAGNPETFRFWQHLANAGLIEGSYTGVAGSGGADHHVLASNTPASRLGNAGWSFDSVVGTPAGNTSAYSFAYGNRFDFGAALLTGYTNGRIIGADEAWGIDVKLDDGKPGRGRVIVRYWDDCTTSSTFNDLDGSYLVSETSKNCALHFANSF